MSVDPQEGKMFRIFYHFVLKELYVKRKLSPLQHTDSTLFRAFFSPALLNVKEIGENRAESTIFF
jgi:hypothetical protein